jgi:uncharacterized protein (DUF697 family)
MTENAKAQDKTAQAEKIVRNHVFGSVAAVVVPLPLLNVAILGGIQLRMLNKLAAHYEVDFEEQRANAIIGTLGGVSMAGAAVSLLRLIPGVGTALTAMSALAVTPASTYALGQVFIKHFESGGTFLTFDAEKAKGDYEDQLEEGKRLAQQSYVGIKP